jgi:hypothetical protein
MVDSARRSPSPWRTIAAVMPSTAKRSSTGSSAPASVAVPSSAADSHSHRQLTVVTTSSVPDSALAMPTHAVPRRMLRSSSAMARRG